MHVVELEEDPCLLELEYDPAEEAGRHLDEVSIFRKGATLVQHRHVPTDHVVVDQQRDFCVEIEAALNVLLLVGLLVHLRVVEGVLNGAVCFII